jgi:DNA repair photolyase
LPQLLATPPTVRRVTRPENLLTRGPFPDRPYVWTLDFARGCPHACVFCPALGREQSPADAVVQLADGLTEQIRNQLSVLRPRPEVVLLGIDTDPFMASPIVQAEVVKAVRVLAEFRVTTWIATRSIPLPTVLESLQAHRRYVRITVSLATADTELQRLLEPHAAPVEQRFQLIAELQKREIPLEVNVEPLLPGLTDTRERVRGLLETLRDLNVAQITAGYLVLRPCVREAVRAALGPMGLADEVLAHYDDGPTRRDGGQPARYLSKAKRQRGYAALMAFAARFDIEVRVGRRSNPDFVPPRRPSAVHAAEVHHMIQSLRRSVSSPA